MSEISSVRLDKWLWAVRIFKTRSLAAEACRQGRVTIGGQPAKPAREPCVNDIVTVRKDEVTFRYKVLQLLENRVGAAKVPEFAENQTPAEEYEKARQASRPQFGFRPKGAGRPVKKQRRQLDRFVTGE